MSLSRIKTRLRRSFQKTLGTYGFESEDLRDITIREAIANRQAMHPNPLTRFGQFGYSQCDEDGITFEIIRRLGIETGVFCEFGVGNGMENNTLALLACGWRGYWAGGEDLAFDVSGSSRLTFEKAWIDRDNIVSLYRNGLKANRAEEADLLSLDLDGNDYHLIEELLKADCRPQLAIVEYNGKHPPPIKFVMDYDPAHQWTGTDYFGASLSAFAELFTSFGYRCICCNAGSGANAFFVPETQAHLFPEIPERLTDIYASPFYFIPHKVGHRQEKRTILNIIR